MATTDDNSIPREPSAYRPTLHFIERFRDRYDEHNRHLDEEIVATTIREGTVTHRQADKVHVESTFGGVRYRLALATDGRVITGHPVRMDEDTARESGRWSADALSDIREFLAADTSRMNDP